MNVNQSTTILFILILINELQLLKTLIASHYSTTTTINGMFVCKFYRRKDLQIDDQQMPNILTFCSGTIIHRKWALTARQCYVQSDWFVSTVITIDNNNQTKEHIIIKIHDLLDLTLVKVKPDFEPESKPIEYESRSVERTKICKLIGISTPDGKPIRVVKGNENQLIYQVWYSGTNLIETNVTVLHFKECMKRFRNGLSEYKEVITQYTMCVNALINQRIEPCAFDRGAPIVCNGKLQGVLIYQRPIPIGLPLHLPTGCYGNIDQTISIYAESLTYTYTTWIHYVLKFK